MLEISKCLERLSGLHLIKRAPVTVALCTSLPLFLPEFSVKAAAPLVQFAHSNDRGPRRDLQVLRGVMGIIQYQYEGLDWISDATSRVATLAQTNAILPIASARSRPKASGLGGRHFKLADMLPFDPAWYLRLAFMVEVIFSKGRLPKDEHILHGFRGLVEAEIYPRGDGSESLEISTP